MENVLNMKDIRDFEKITEDEAKSIFQELSLFPNSYLFK